MKKKNLLVLITILVFALVGCSSGNNGEANNASNNSTNTSNTEVSSDVNSSLKVGFVTDEGGINDASFNQGVWEGVTKATNEFGIESKYQESSDANAYRPNFETLIDDGMDLVVGAGFKMGDTIAEEAAANPDINFAIVDVDPENASENLLGIMFRAEEPSFLVGYIAGLTTETGKVGFVGGQESTIIDGFEYGYKAGVAYAAKELGTEIEIMSQYVGDFSDAQKGKAIATTMYQQGCDVVFHAAGGAGDGVIEAAKEENKWAIGVDRDQNDLAPDNVLTSAMKNADVVIYNLIKDVVNGEEFQGGQTLVYGLKDEGAVGIAPTSANNVAADVLEKVDLVEEKIISEEIVVPADAATYETYLESLN